MNGTADGDTGPHPEYAWIAAALAAFDAGDDEALLGALGDLMPSLGDTSAEVVGTEPSAVPGARGLMSWASEGRAIVLGDRALLAITAESEPGLEIDGSPTGAMRRIGASDRWCTAATIEVGRTHAYEFLIDGRRLGVGDFAGYLPDSLPRPGVRSGALTGPFRVESEIYPGTATEYWLYTSPGLDPAGAPVLVWTDGDWFAGVGDALAHRLRVVSDNLVADGRIPPMVHVLVTQEAEPPFVTEPQYTAQTSRALLRSVQYDTVSDRYVRHLVDEVLADAGGRVALRTDGYSRAIAGASSGGIAAFAAAWCGAGAFTRVLSHIGSFTGLQWDGGPADVAGFLLPQLVRREHRNLRVWLSDGQWDIDVAADGRRDIATAGSWPLANLALASALKASGYDFHLRFGTAGHNSAQASLDLPESLAWLWRGYDPQRSHEDYEQDAAERALPMFRVAVANRSGW